MRNLSFLKYRESPCDSPFLPNSPCDGGALGAVFSGLTSLVGGAANSISAENANKTNLQIAQLNADLQRETNKHNEELAREARAYDTAMWNKQNAYNEKMWARQNEYNSPANQVALLKQAGINPAYFYGQGSSAASQLSSADAKQAQTSYNTAPQINYQARPVEYGGVGSAVGSAINAYYQNRLMDSEAKKSGATTEQIIQSTEQEKKSFYARLQFLQNQAQKEGYVGDMARCASVKVLLAFIRPIEA